MCRPPVYVIAKSKQTDGDYHITFCDSPSFTSFSRTHCLNAEVVPYLQCNPLPANGTQVTMRGTLRFDGPQDWWEIHPVEWISTTKCMVTGTPPLQAVGLLALPTFQPSSTALELETKP
jgi:hypothetical protein